jgi:hypothetical protein
MIAEGIAVGAGIEVCRRVLARNTDAPVKIVSQAYGFYEASPAIRLRRQAPAAWAQLEPTSLAVAVRVLVAADPPAEAGRWSAPYPTLQVRYGTGRDLVIETRVDPPAILARDFREQLQAVLEQALLIAQGPALGRLGQAVSHA